MKFLKVAGVLILLLAIGGIATMPPAVKPYHETPELPDDLNQLLAQTEQEADAAFDLIPNTEKRIYWQETGSKTPLSIVYFHGFSATRQEIAPVGEMIADRLNANLFETRLKGHGRVNEALLNVTAEDWLADAAEALAIGATIGERVIVIGTSTGATLALAAIDHPVMERVDAIVMLAPNLVLQDANSEILTWPGGPPIARMIIGESRSWPPRNELQGLYWTTTYPLQTVIETVRLMKYARDNLPQKVSQRLMTISSPDDQVVDPIASYEYIKKVSAPANVYVAFTDSGDLGQHVLAGDILSPETNEAITDIIAKFVESSKLPLQ